MVEWGTGRTHHFIMVVADLLAHELVGPGLDAGAAFALDAGDDERHVCGRFGGEEAFGGGGL
jgi:hypothetical protein